MDVNVNDQYQQGAVLTYMKTCIPEMVAKNKKIKNNLIIIVSLIVIFLNTF